MATAFELLHPAIQEELYRMRWTELRQIQVDAIHKLLADQKHLLISAETAGGKTEAAFLPILSQIVDDNSAGIRALYVGPLKALINDQFRRLEELCQRSQIPVFKWHGDVGQGVKQHLFRSPAGVLLITPESIESLFINHSPKLYQLFLRLSYIVIDEVHSFIGTERGVHLRSLLYRLLNYSKENVRLVGLSATIGDIQKAKKWIDPKHPHNVELLTSSEKRSVRYLIKGYLREKTADEKDDSAPTSSDLALVDDIIKAFYGKTALIFANSRSLLEFYADLTARLVERQRKPNIFRVHHGSLSKSEREQTEEALRSSSPAVTFCTSSLELGIDVGNVAAVGQIGPPWSVSSLRQRLGRSGRRQGEDAVLWMYIVEDKPQKNSAFIDRLYPSLLQAVAMTELIIEGWCEPPEISRLHLSTLIQQVMSIITQAGGASATTLYNTLIANGAFKNVEKEVFLKVLRGIGDRDLIEQAPDGTLILGLKGEQIVRNFNFYSAFKTEKELRVICNGRTIGTVLGLPGTGAEDYLILAGKRWRVLEVDSEKEEILVEPAKGGSVPFFGVSLGADILPRVREKMYYVLSSQALPSYLDPQAQQILSSARDTARESDIIHNNILVLGNETIWFTWTGSRINRTLWCLGRYADFQVANRDIALVFQGVSKEALLETYKGFIANHPTIEELAFLFPMKAMEKYDNYLPDEILNYSFARDFLDIEGAILLIEQAFHKKEWP